MLHTSARLLLAQSFCAQPEHGRIRAIRVLTCRSNAFGVVTPYRRRPMNHAAPTVKLYADARAGAILYPSPIPIVREFGMGAVLTAVDSSELGPSAATAALALGYAGISGVA